MSKKMLFNICTFVIAFVGIFHYAGNYAEASLDSRSIGSQVNYNPHDDWQVLYINLDSWSNYQIYNADIAVDTVTFTSAGNDRGDYYVDICIRNGAVLLACGPSQSGSTYTPSTAQRFWINDSVSIGNDVTSATSRVRATVKIKNLSTISTVTAQGRKLDGVYVDLPPSDLIGGGGFTAMVGSSEGQHVADDTITWSPSGRLSCNSPWSSGINIAGGGSKSCNCNGSNGSVTMTFTARGPSAGGQITVAASDTMNCNYPALNCSPSNQSVNTGQTASFNVSGGSGTYTWNAPGSSNTGGSGSNFSTSYSSSGTKTVTVLSAGGTMSDTCTVNVNVIQRSLTVNRTSGGSVTSSPSGINCGSDCSENYNDGTSVTLTANPSAGYNFAGWSGDCSGTGTCNLTMTNNRNVTATFSANPVPEADIRCNGSGGSCSIGYNATAVIEWCGTGGGRHNCNDSTSCTATGTAGAGNPPDTLSGNWTTPNLSSNATYTLSCTGPGGTTNDTVTVNVAAPPPETVDLTCNGSGGSCSINYGDSATIAWTSTNVSSCSVTPGSFTPGSSNIGQSTGALTSDVTYNITCDGGIATDSVTVNVTQPTINSFQCDGSSPTCNIPFNATANIVWTTSSAVTSCSFTAGLGSGGWSGTSGNVITPNLTADETYSITCQPASVSSSVTVVVGAPPPPDFSIDFGLTPIVTNPIVSNVSVTEPNYCTSGPLAVLDWGFFDPNGDTDPSGSQIQVSTNSGFTNIIYDSCAPSGTQPDGTCDPANDSNAYITPVFSYNTNYYLRIRSWNSVGDVSNYESMSICSGPGCDGSQTFWTTPDHAYPQTNFSPNPINPSVGGSVVFTDTTIFGDGSGSSWNWTFNGGTPSSATGSGAKTVTYGAEGTFPATLIATDNAGVGGSLVSCNITRNIYVQGSLPKWKEVAPK